MPRDQLVVITGLSGSGKSSLAFDTIYAEGQRRYVESLSAYARQFLEMMQKPDVDQIEGLSPAISIEQKTTSEPALDRRHRHRDLRLHAPAVGAVGVPYSPATGLPIESQTVSQMVDRVLALPEGTRLYLLAPSCAAARASTARSWRSCRRKGFQRVKIDGSSTRSPTRRRSTRSSSTTSTWWSTASWCATRTSRSARRFARDRAEARRRHRHRRFERRGRTTGAMKRGTTPEPHRLLAKFACPVSGFTIPEIEPRLFSFNNPFGACPACDGLGTRCSIDPELVVPDETPLPARRRDRALGKSDLALLHADARGAGASTTVSSLDDAVARAPEEARDVILYGTGERGRSPSPMTTAAQLRDHQAVRGRDPQPRAALEGDRQRLGARGDRALPVRPRPARPAAATG
jgi:excinuclease ABC subunit A